MAVVVLGVFVLGLVWFFLRVRRWALRREVRRNERLQAKYGSGSRRR